MNWQQACSLIARACLSLTLAGLAQHSGAEEVFPAQQWRKVAPADSGWSADKLQAADEFARTLRTDAYLVIHRGVVVHEFGETAKPMNLYSARKSLLSMLFGIHADRGEVQLDKTLAELHIDDKQGLSEDEKTATVRQLMQSRSGVYHPASYETSEAAASRPVRGSHKPGEHWYYNNWDFNALGTVFRQMTGKTVFEALREDLAEPLQFEDFDVARDTQFVLERVSEHPAYVIRLSARDLARAGLLMARNGRWNGRQAISEAWVAESTASYSDIGYGYMWWIGTNGLHFGQPFPGKAYSGIGNWGQFVLVDPVRDLVIVHRTEGAGMFRSNVSPPQFGRLVGKILAALPPG